MVEAGLSDGAHDKQTLKDDEIQGFLPSCRNCKRHAWRMPSSERRKQGRLSWPRPRPRPVLEKLPEGMVFKSVKEGTGASPKATDTVKVHYEGKLANGKVFDSSIKRNEPASSLWTRSFRAGAKACST